MLFYLTILNLIKFLNKEVSKSSKNEFYPIIMVVVKAWNHTNFVSKNHILNGYDNTLYDVYSLIKSEKTLWKALYKKIQS